MILKKQKKAMSEFHKLQQMKEEYSIDFVAENF